MWQTLEACWQHGKPKREKNFLQVRKIFFLFTFFRGQFSHENYYETFLRGGWREKRFFNLLNRLSKDFKIHVNNFKETQYFFYSYFN